MATGKLLDKLLSNLNVHAEPFARCTISSGWRLGLPGPSGVMLHFVLEGRGMLRDAAGQRSELRPYFLVIVPPGTRHDLESPGNIEHEVRVEGPPPKGVWNPLLLAGSLDSETNLVVACGLVRVQFGDSLGLFDHMKEMMVVDLSDVPQVGTAFQDIFTEQSQPSPGSEAMTAALMSQCMVHLLRKLCEDDQCPLPWLAALENERLAPRDRSNPRAAWSASHSGVIGRGGGHESVRIRRELRRCVQPSTDDARSPCTHATRGAVAAASEYFCR